MDAESRKSFRHGFILKEADLRRINDLVEDQFRKVFTNGKSVSSFRMKFKNGVIAEKSSLDEVLSQENIGSSQIVRLFYELKHEEPSDPTFVHVEFINVDLDDEPGYVSARFKVFGHSRDWVFVTSSLLEERIDKIKRFAPNQLGEKSPSRLFFRLMTPLLGIAIALGFVFSLQRNMAKRPSAGQLLEEEWKAGKIKEPVEALIFLENQRTQRASSFEFFGLRPILYIVFLFGSAFGILFFYGKYYPVYNFLWGEYVEEFNRRESIRRFWIIIIVVGIIVSFIGGILANTFNLWKPHL